MTANIQAVRFDLSSRIPEFAWLKSSVKMEPSESCAGNLLELDEHHSDMAGNGFNLAFRLVSISKWPNAP
jgi:hypothetical protein